MSSIHTRVYHNTDQTYTVFRDGNRNGDGWDEGGRYRQGLFFDPIPLDALPVTDTFTMVLASVPAGQQEWERLLDEAAQECAQWQP